MRVALYMFLAVAMVGIIAAQGTPEQRVAKQDGSTETKKPNTADTEHASPNVTVIVKQESAPSDKAPNPNSQEDIDIQKKLARFTFWLVVVGCIQAAILGLTVRAISRQTIVARHSERAWMIAKIEGEVIPDSEGYRMVRFSVRCINNGKTPAFLLEMGNHGVVLPREQALPEPQPPCNKENTNIWQGKGIPLQPKDSVLRHNWSTIAPDLQRLIHGEDWLWVYGYIKYRDAFGKNCETRYCFLWDCVHDIPGAGKGTHWLPDGPASYNLVT